MMETISARNTLFGKLPCLPNSILVALLVGVALPTLPALAADYLTEIKPIFQTHCYRCHAGEHPKSGLRLDTGAFAVNGGDRGPVIIPGSSAESPLIQVLQGSHNAIPQMPYRDTPLSEGEITLIAQWIDQGAPAPKDEIPGEHLHWAFVSPQRPQPPATPRHLSPGNAIDNFVYARLTTAHLHPSDPAEPTALFRRLYLDIIGLPPSPDDVDRYLNNYAPNRTEEVIDQLLASPQFGERWGRHWLDLARYADSNGYSVDSERSIWRYRDYVINAYNENRPFDQFVMEQLAGDLIPDATTDQLIATGFHRNTQINQEGGIDREQFRIESVVDRVGTTGTAFLGLTIACAQCHDHKFDPVAQSEYYQLFAFFNNQDEPTLETPLPGEREARMAHQHALDLLEEEIRSTEARLQERVFDWEKYLSEADIKDLSPHYRALLTKPRELRTAEESQELFDHFAEDNEAYQTLMKEQRNLRRQRPRITSTMILRERDERRPTYIHIKGDFTRHGPEVSPGTPAALPPSTTSGNLNRLDFAQWLTRPDHPLLARVTVNRIWQQYFGRGIVETENDFGTQGIPPSHPKLLDWLAVELIESDWNIKALHKKILMSRTYQQTSVVTSYGAERDPSNRLFGRQSRMRLEAEIVRDVALSASNLLATRIGGPSTRPPQPEGVMTLGQVQRSWRPNAGENRYRRGLYTFFYRATPHPALTVFDSPDAFSACSRRIRSNTPLQALTLLNDPAFFEIAQAFANRIESLPAKSVSDRIRQAFRLCLGRKPRRSELNQLVQALNSHQPDDASANWLFLARILLNLDETITRE